MKQVLCQNTIATQYIAINSTILNLFFIHSYLVMWVKIENGCADECV